MYSTKLTRHLLRTNTISGMGDMVERKRDIAPALMELIFYWGRDRNKQTKK